MPVDISLHTIEIPYLIEVIAFLLSVVIIVPLFQALRISPILGFLSVGALIGPHSLGVIKDIDSVQHFAELGVVFLLFTIGLELSFERLKSYSRLIFGFGASQVILCSLVIGTVAYLWGNSTEAAIIIGLCLSLSSTAMVMQLLTERGELATRHGRASFSVLLFQDLAVVPILILLSVFGRQSDGNALTDIIIALVNAIVAITIIVIFGRFGLRKLFEIAARTRSIDVFTAMSLLAILAISLITGLAGLSMALGAFLAGLLLAETEFRHQIESEIAPFKGLFLGLFFMAVGMNIDFVVAFERGVWVILSVLGLISFKAVLIFACALVFRLKIDDALRTSLLLAEGGEFAFLVIGQATLIYGIIDHDVGQFMIVVAGISMMLTPLLAYLGQRLATLLNPKKSFSTTYLIEDDIHDHIVLAGFGRVGLAVAEVLKSEAIPYIAIDNSAEVVTKNREKDKSLYVGDATRAEVLKHARLDHAAALLITMNSAEDALKCLSVATQHWPDLTIIVRSRDTTHSEALIAAGASQVVPETLEASLQLSNYVLRATGFTRDEANDCVDAIRKLNFGEIN